jgi:predicted RNA-binding Zn ribbon-like protein
MQEFAMPISLLKINAIRLVGGVAVLDYLNTCNGRRPNSSLGEVVDNLLSLEDVVYWFHHAGLINAEERAHYLSLVPSSPFQQSAGLKRLVDFRESLYLLFLPIAEGKPVTQASLALLNQTLIETAACRYLVPTGFIAFWRWRHATTLDEMTASLLGRLAVQAADLMTSSQLVRLKVCATLSCDWLFLDISKNGRRRWCQMNICGSREKARKALAAHEPLNAFGYATTVQGQLLDR